MNLLLLILNGLAVGAVSLLCRRRRAFSFLDPVWAFLGGYFLNYCVRPALFLIDPQLGSAYAGMFGDDTIARGFNAALLFAMAGFSGFALGNLSFSAAAHRLSKALPGADFRRVIGSQLLAGVAFGFLLAGCWGLRGFISQAGWVGSLLLLLQGGQRGEFTQVILGNGIYMFAMQLSLVGWALICAHWIVVPPPPRAISRMLRRGIQVGWFSVILAIWVAFGERASILTVLFIPFALKYALPRTAENWIGSSAAAPERSGRNALILVAIMFVIAGPLGVLIKGIEASPATAVAMSISAWDGFEFTVLAQNRVHVRNLAWGRTYAQDLFYTWLPRKIFPSKPERYGNVLIQDLLAPELMDNEGGTFPPGILVEAFANFGYLGLFFVPLLIGIFCRAVYLRLQSSDLYWATLMAFLLPNLASFRGFGGFLALLVANCLLLYAVIMGVWSIQAVHEILARPQLTEQLLNDEG